MGDYNFPDGLAISPNQQALAKTSLSASEDNQASWISQYGIAGRTWEAAPFLAHYLTPSRLQHDYSFDPSCSLFRDASNSTSSTSAPSRKTILELGSGNALLAIHHLAPLLHEDDEIILSDLEQVVPLLEANVAKRPAGRACNLHVRALQWGLQAHIEELQQYLNQNKKPLSHILCSDLVYFPHLLEPLLRSLLWLTDDPETGATIEIIIGYKVRSLTKETPFWESFGVYFELWPVIRRPSSSSLAEDDSTAGLTLTDESDGETQDEDTIFIFLARRKVGTSFEAKELPSDLMKGKDGQFEEFLMLRSMQDSEW